MNRNCSYKSAFVSSARAWQLRIYRAPFLNLICVQHPDQVVQPAPQTSRVAKPAIAGNLKTMALQYKKENFVDKLRISRLSDGSITRIANSGIKSISDLRSVRNLPEKQILIF